MVHLFLPEVVEISVEIAVDLFVVVCTRFTSVFSTGNIHFQYSLWTVTMEFQIFTWLCARLFLAEIRLVDLSGSHFHGHGVGWLLNFSQPAGIIHRHVFGHPLTHQNPVFTAEGIIHRLRELFTDTLAIEIPLA